MHFGFALELSDIDLWNIDLLDTHLDLLDTDIPSILFVSIVSSRRLQDMSSRHLQDMFSRLLQDVFSVTIFCLPRRLGRQNCYTEDLLKTNKCLLDLMSFYKSNRICI